MKIGKVDVINSPSARIEMHGGSAGPVVLALVTVAAIFGAVKVFQLHTELQREVQKLRSEIDARGTLDS